MADKKNQFNDDEYHFDDLDALNPPEPLALDDHDVFEEKEQHVESHEDHHDDSLDDLHDEGYEEHHDEEKESDGPSKTEEQEGHQFFSQRANVIRNSIIALGVFLLLMVIYKVISSFTSSSPSTTKVAPMSSMKAPSMPVMPKQSSPSESKMSAPVVEQPMSLELNSPSQNTFKQDLNRVEENQQHVNAQVSVINQQVSGVSHNVESMLARMNELNQVIQTLEKRVSEQSEAIEKLVKKKSEAMKAKAIKKPEGESLKLYVQAIIPGRAWLIATTGATLTVREGTLIKDYGMVKLIDPIQGRVITSSGRIIRFSQADS